MQAPLDRPLVSPVIVGRARPLQTLAGSIQRLTEGMGGVVLLAGEAGIGKSRLVRETAGQARRLGALVLQGNCFEPDRALPYAPLLELLQGLRQLHTPQEIAELAGASAQDLLPLLPELAVWLPPARPLPPLGPEQEKRRLFHALTQLFLGLCARQPLLLVVEDVHWSDDSSLELLAYLARHATARPLLLLLSYRSDETHPALVHMLSGLDRERLAVEVRLGRLGVAEVDAMLRAMLALRTAPRADLLHLLYRLSEGNPFFVEELVRSLAGAGVRLEQDGSRDPRALEELPIPRSVQDAVRRRMERLSDAARQALRYAAVAGRRFDFALLLALLGCGEPALLALLKELIGAQLVVEESAEQFVFRHALTREAVYTALLTRERKALHRQVAQELQRLHGQGQDQPTGDLAYHFFTAGEWAQALNYSRRAGERALALYAPGAAIEHLTRALEAAAQLSLPAPVDLHRQRGLAYEILGEFESARRDHETALALARAAGDPHAEWRSLLDLGLLWAGQSYEQTGAYVSQALELARSMGDSWALARSLNRYGNWLANRERPGEARQCHMEALAIFEELRDRQGIAQTRDLLGMASALAGDLLQCAANYEHAIPLLRELGDRQGLASSLTTLCLRCGCYQSETLVPAAAHVATSLECAAQALAVAREIGWRAGEAFALLGWATCLGPAGDYGTALSHASEALAIAEEIGHRQWQVMAHWTLGHLYRDVLALTPAREHLEQALAIAREMGSLFWADGARAALARTCILQGDLARAAVILEPMNLTELSMQGMARRQVWLARAELALARRAPGEALAIAERLLATALGSGDRPAAPALWLLRGQALAALQQPAEAEASLRLAADQARAQGVQNLEWRSAVALARLYEGQRGRDEAEAQADSARTIITAIAATLPPDLQTSFLATATAQLPAPRPLSPRQAAKQAYGGLTEREREVAALVARGCSNRAIAETLVLGERTVETHVANILAKLSFTSRAQIAAWAAEHGLTH